MPPVKTATSRQSTLAQHGRVNSDHQHTPSWSPAGGTAHALAVGMVSRRRLESARLHSVSRRCAPRRPPIGTRLSPCGGPLKARRVRADCWSLLARLSAATEASRDASGRPPPDRLGTPSRDATSVRQEITRIDEELASPYLPDPIRWKLIQIRAAHVQVIQQHERERIVPPSRE